MTWNRRQQQSVVAALEKIAGPVTEKAPGRWGVSLWNGAVHPVEATLENRWLTLQAPAGGGDAAPWDLLRRNAGLAGLARLVRQQAPGTTAQAEIPVGGGDLVAELGVACAGLRQALEIEADTGVVPASQGGVDRSRLCAEAGWPFEERHGGGLSVQLEATGTPLRARVEEDAGGGLRVTAPLLRARELGSSGRQAVATALLATSATVRMVRACAIEDHSGVEAGFEARLSAAAEPATLDHALAALSVSCGLCVLEARALQEEPIATCYLEAREYVPASVSPPGRRPGAGGS